MDEFYNPTEDIENLLNDVSIEHRSSIFTNTSFLAMINIEGGTVSFDPKVEAMMKKMDMYSSVIVLAKVVMARVFGKKVTKLDDYLAQYEKDSAELSSEILKKLHAMRKNVDEAISFAQESQKWISDAIKTIRDEFNDGEQWK